LGNGVPLKEALTDLHRRYARRSKRHPFVYALDAWLKRMHEGKSNFDSIVDGWIPSEERMLFTGGTDLHRSLTSAADVMDSKRAIRGTIVKKTAMPIVLVVMAIVVVYILAGNLIPTIIDTMPPGAVLVGLGGTVKATSETIIHGLPYGVAALFAFICFAAWSPSFGWCHPPLCCAQAWICDKSSNINARWPLRGLRPSWLCFIGRCTKAVPLV
jgi:type II secretory pathway component PulF